MRQLLLSSRSPAVKMQASQYHHPSRPTSVQSTCLRADTVRSRYVATSCKRATPAYTLTTRLGRGSDGKINVSVVPRRSSSGTHYDPPTGNLFGVPPGGKYEKEGWEGWYYYGFCGGVALLVVAYTFKPDTSIQTWALEEARRRLEREGILEDPHPEIGSSTSPSTAASSEAGK